MFSDDGTYADVGSLLGPLTATSRRCLGGYRFSSSYSLILARILLGSGQQSFTLNFALRISSRRTYSLSRKSWYSSSPALTGEPPYYVMSASRSQSSTEYGKAWKPPIAAYHEHALGTRPANTESASQASIMKHTSDSSGFQARAEKHKNSPEESGRGHPPSHPLGACFPSCPWRRGRQRGPWPR